MSGTNLTNEQKNFQNTVEILRRQREAQADLVVQLNVQVVAQNEYINALTARITAMQEIIDALPNPAVQTTNSTTSTVTFAPLTTIATDGTIS